MVRFKDIHIPQPCSVPYDSLPGNEIKRFCGSCEKHVYDFRGKDELYFNSIIHTHGKVCGVFYEDEISKYNQLAIKKFPKRVLIKIIGFAFLIKSFLTIQHSKASEHITHKTSQRDLNTTDSTKIKTVSKNIIRFRPQINIYINDSLYKESVYPQSGYLYLPDSIKPDDKIKVQVVNKKYFKPRTYSFKYSSIDTITIKIIGKRPIRIFRRRHVGGCPSNFW